MHAALAGSPVPPAEALRRSAARLVAALAAHDDAEYRLAVLKRVVRRLGEEQYPLFLRLLNVIAESDDTRAKRLVADTFGTALRRMDLPGGALSSWGATRLPESTGPLAASALSGHFFGATPRRLLGPVEYLVVWHLQRTQRVTLGIGTFQQALAKLIGLLDHSAEARVLYPQKLAADAQNELEGAYTRTTREHLAALARAWQAGLPPEDIARAAAESHADTPQRAWIVRDL